MMRAMCNATTHTMGLVGRAVKAKANGTLVAMGQAEFYAAIVAAVGGFGLG